MTWPTPDEEIEAGMMAQEEALEVLMNNRTGSGKEQPETASSQISGGDSEGPSLRDEASPEQKWPDRVKLLAWPNNEFTVSVDGDEEYHHHSVVEARDKRIEELEAELATLRGDCAGWDGTE